MTHKKSGYFTRKYSIRREKLASPLAKLDSISQIQFGKIQIKISIEVLSKIAIELQTFQKNALINRKPKTKRQNQLNDKKETESFPSH